MSISSRFGSRQQQSHYDNCIKELVNVLAKRVVKFYNIQPAQEQKFVQVVTELYEKFREIEKNKSQDLKISRILNQLVNSINSGTQTKYELLIEERNQYKQLIQRHTQGNDKLQTEFAKLKRQMHSDWKPKAIKQQFQENTRIKPQKFIIKKASKRNSSLLVFSNRDFKISPENFKERFKQYNDNKLDQQHSNEKKMLNGHQKYKINPQHIDSLVYPRNKNYLRGKSKSNFKKMHNTISHQRV